MDRAGEIRRAESDAMIRYALVCENGDEFEAWFGSIADFDVQAEKGQIGCPVCGDARVRKAPMAPAIAKSKDTAPSERAVAMAMAHKVREHVRDHFDYVGERFPEEARKMHDGESEERPIWGEATPEQAKAMMEDGLPVAPLPPEVAPALPKKVN
ncbi:MAG: DUF1178 family protein [Pseudomonadota bacterium]|jgi:hypothetical protein